MLASGWREHLRDMPTSRSCAFRERHLSGVTGVLGRLPTCGLWDNSDFCTSVPIRSPKAVSPLKVPLTRQVIVAGIASRARGTFFWAKLAGASHLLGSSRLCSLMPDAATIRHDPR